MRLRGYDYTSPGYYFVTICTKKMQVMFGDVLEGKMKLNSLGQAIVRCWADLPNHYSCRLDAFVVMPNHVHGIIVIPDRPIDVHPAPLNNFTASSAIHVPAGLNPLVRWSSKDAPFDLNPPVRGGGNHMAQGKMFIQQSVSEIVRGFKTFSALAVNRVRGTPGAALWMKSFHDRIIRNLDDIERAREYIRLNPIKWHHDRKNTNSIVY